MPFVETEIIALEFPDDWRADYEEDVIAIVDPDEIGALEITALQKEQGVVEREELQSFASDLIEDGLSPTEFSLNDFAGLYFEYNREQLHWREWFLSQGNTLVFATYTTEPEQAGLDDAIIDQILDTLIVV